jgi:hypothetical protein
MLNLFEIWKEKVNGGLNLARIEKIIQQFTILFWELYAKIIYKKERRESSKSNTTIIQTK